MVGTAAVTFTVISVGAVKLGVPTIEMLGFVSVVVLAPNDPPPGVKVALLTPEPAARAAAATAFAMAAATGSPDGLVGLSGVGV